MNCSSVRPHCLMMSERVPLASSSCMGTTVLNTTSPSRFSSDTWLPFWRSSKKPARFSARMTRCPETLGNFGMLLGDFDGGPKRFGIRRPRFRGAPGFEVQLDRFLKIRARALHISALRRDAELRAAGNIQPILPGYECGKTVVHTPILTELPPAHKISMIWNFTTH